MSKWLTTMPREKLGESYVSAETNSINQGKR